MLTFSDIPTVLPKEIMKQLLSCLSFIRFLEFTSVFQTRFENFMEALHIRGPNAKQKTKNTKQTKNPKKPNKKITTKARK